MEEQERGSFGIEKIYLPFLRVRHEVCWAGRRQRMAVGFICSVRIREQLLQTVQIYTEECIRGIKIDYEDNQQCIDLIEKVC